MVVLDVEICEEQNLDMSVGVLQYIAIGDHETLTNRDKENQHPIKAIEGLAEKLQEFDDYIKSMATDEEIKEVLENAEDES